MDELNVEELMAKISPYDAKSGRVPIDPISEEEFDNLLKDHTLGEIINLVANSEIVISTQCADLLSRKIFESSHSVPIYPNLFDYAFRFMIGNFYDECVRNIDDYCYSTIGFATLQEFRVTVSLLFQPELVHFKNIVGDMINAVLEQLHKVYFRYSDLTELEERVWFKEVKTERHIHDLTCYYELKEFDPKHVIDFANKNNMYIEDCYTPLCNAINKRLTLRDQTTHKVGCFDEEYIEDLFSNFVDGRANINFSMSIMSFNLEFTAMIEERCSEEFIDTHEIIHTHCRSNTLKSFFALNGRLTDLTRVMKSKPSTRTDENITSFLRYINKAITSHFSGRWMNDILLLAKELGNFSHKLGVIEFEYLFPEYTLHLAMKSILRKRLYTEERYRIYSCSKTSDDIHTLNNSDIPLLRWIASTISNNTKNASNRL